MADLTKTQVRSSAPESDADTALSDSGDLPSRLLHYRLLLEQSLRHVVSYSALSFIPLLHLAFEAVPTAAAAIRRKSRLLLERLHRYVVSYSALEFIPLLRPTFRAVPISPSADAIQLKWGDWAAIISYMSAGKPLFSRSQ